MAALIRSCWSLIDNFHRWLWFFVGVLIMVIACFAPVSQKSHVATEIGLSRCVGTDRGARKDSVVRKNQLAFQVQLRTETEFGSLGFTDEISHGEGYFTFDATAVILST